ncbi:MAG: hypothetical protein RLZZ414_810 [Bacteroidota bacterium]|jgi:predicted DNA-binding transcriptional regulator YafY
MIEQQKILRILQIIAKLRQSTGYTKTELAKEFNVSVRTIERYFNLFEELGFIIQKDKTKFKLKVYDANTLQHENWVVFTLEEAQAIHQVFRNGKLASTLQKSILDKLYPLTEMDEVAHFIESGQTTKHISTLSQAIKNKNQVKLVNYNSLNSNTIQNRLIEPIKFTKYYESLIAFDVEKKEMRNFKPTRMAQVEILKQTWQYENQHQKFSTDIFNFTSDKNWEIKINLSPRAYQLLIEEFPQAKNHTIHQKNIYELTCNVQGLEAPARFLQGFIQEIQIIYPNELKQLLIQNLQKGLKNLMD